METPSPQCIGQEFVRQYYTILHEVPEQLHRFYSHDSCFVHGGVDRPGEATPLVQGQQDIHQKIMNLSFRDCYVKIGQVDSQPTVGGAVVVQVTGELSNDGQPMRRFMQTFVLVSQSPKKYYVHNDIFRYQDEVFADAESDCELTDEIPDGEPEIEMVMPDQRPAPVHHHVHSVSPARPDPAVSMYYDPPQQPLSNGTLHLDEPEPVAPVTPKMPEPEPEPVAMPVVQAEEPKDMYEPPTPVIAEKSVEMEMPEPEPEQHKAQSSGSMTWAAMLQRGDGGSGPVPQAPPPASKAHLGTGPSKTGSVMSDPKPMDNGSQARPQRDQRPQRERPTRDSRDTREVSRQGERPQGGPPSGDNSLARINQYPDSQQVFVGNLPHTMSEKDLRDYFGKWGTVVDSRINKKSDRNSEVPNYGFVVFDDDKAVQNVLQNRGQFTLDHGHRLNVEEKKQRGETGGRGGPRGGGRGGSMMGGRGGGMGNGERDNRDRGNMGWGAPRSSRPEGGRGGGGGPSEGRGGSRGGRGGFSGPPRR